AFSLLGENGGIRLSNGHACSECTQDYKTTADYTPLNNNCCVLLLEIKMIVIDGIVMGPVHCAADNCTADFLNAHGEALCATHITEFSNWCCVGCRNIKVQGTQACPQHQKDWSHHCQLQTKSTLAHQENSNLALGCPG
ncbi:hypothetical protein BYT27DRAFT_7110693, partial [Phlegmacium glaucopus]